MRISDWSSDVCSSDLARSPDVASGRLRLDAIRGATSMSRAYNDALDRCDAPIILFAHPDVYLPAGWLDRAVETLSRLTASHPDWAIAGPHGVLAGRSDEHTSELQSLMRISSA